VIAQHLHVLDDEVAQRGLFYWLRAGFIRAGVRRHIANADDP